MEMRPHIVDQSDQAGSDSRFSQLSTSFPQTQNGKLIHDHPLRLSVLEDNDTSRSDKFASGFLVDDTQNTTNTNTTISTVHNSNNNSNISNQERLKFD